MLKGVCHQRLNQSLMRAMDILEAVKDDALAVPALSERVGLTTSTTRRLANTLTERGYLRFVPQFGYHLGPRMLELGFLAQLQTELVQIARAPLDALAEVAGETVYLAEQDQDECVIVDHVPGGRRVSFAIERGDRFALARCAIGIALLLDQKPYRLNAAFDRDWPEEKEAARQDWMREFQFAQDLQLVSRFHDHGDTIATIAAPIRNQTGILVAAIAMSCPAQTLSQEKCTVLEEAVRETAASISASLGREPHSV